MKKKNENGCHGCKHHADFIGICTNAESEWCASFTFVRCEKYEEAEDDKKES